MDKHGRFIVFEGIDGSGKSTQIKKTGTWLENHGHKVYLTFEPTDGPVGTLIRKMLTGEVETDQRTIASLFAADRTDHLLNEKDGVCSKIDQGQVVLCDRYYFSSYAYHAQHMDMDWVIHANLPNAQLLRPDLTVFIDVEPELCFERIKNNRSGFEMYEKLDIMKKVRANYFTAFEKLKGEENIVVVDGNQSIEDVEHNIQNEILRIIEVL